MSRKLYLTTDACLAAQLGQPLDMAFASVLNSATAVFSVFWHGPSPAKSAAVALLKTGESNINVTGHDTIRPQFRRKMG